MMVGWAIPPQNGKPVQPVHPVHLFDNAITEAVMTTRTNQTQRGLKS